jgi:GT2 family glycosyltransferase
LYKAIGGFNEEYTQGYGYEDNSFRDRIIKAGILVVLNDDLLVTHQWHAKVHPKDYRPLLNRNKAIYDKEFPNHE